MLIVHQFTARTKRLARETDEPIPAIYERINMTLKEWLDKKISTIDRRGHEPLDTYGNEYREGYRKACCDVRALLSKSDPAPTIAAKEKEC